jgi:DNA polymerase-3 subunit gamma/tau
MAKDVRTIPLMELTEQIKDRFSSQANNWEKQQITRALFTLSKADVSYKNAQNQRLLVEVTLMELGSLQQESEKKKD